MTNPISIFIMDVSDSSKEEIGPELSKYLTALETKIIKWTENITPTLVSHRAGDEIVVVSSGYATAYTIAFYINQLWPFKAHKPYFGLSFGDINEDIHHLNIEKWIHPLMKQARIANHKLKDQTSNRGQFNFEFNPISSGYVYEANKFSEVQLQTLFNAILQLQQEIMNEQTNIQSLVCSLYFILNKQSEISTYLGRSKSTISTHLKKGKCESIHSAFQDMIKVLNTSNHTSLIDEQVVNDLLQKNIRKIVQQQLNDYF